jgi:hypothetical protein
MVLVDFEERARYGLRRQGTSEQRVLGEGAEAGQPTTFDRWGEVAVD